MNPSSEQLHTCDYGNIAMKKNDATRTIAWIMEHGEVHALESLNNNNYNVDACLENAARTGDIKLMLIFNAAGWDLTQPLENGEDLLVIASMTKNNARMVNFMAQQVTPVPPKP